MHTNQLSELSALLAERGIIATDVMPFCLVNPNHIGHALGKFTRDVGNDDIAEAFGVTVVELLQERDACPSMEDALGALMAKRVNACGMGWLVRYYLPSSRGGYTTKLVYAQTLGETMCRMLQA